MNPRGSRSGPTRIAASSWPSFRDVNAKGTYPRVFHSNGRPIANLASSIGCREIADLILDAHGSGHIRMFSMEPMSEMTPTEATCTATKGGWREAHQALQRLAR